MKYALGLAAGLLLAASAHAEFAVTADAGTPGAGAHLVVPMESNINGRFGVNGWSHSSSKHLGSVDYALKESLRTADALFDWYPAAMPVHVSAGVIYNNNSASANAKPNANGGYTINGHDYTAADVGNLSGGLDFRKAAPYLGIGWGNALAGKQNWNFNVDLGAFYQAKPNVHLVSIGCTTSPTVCRTLAADVAADRAKFGADIGSHRTFPVARVSLSYKF
jgi:hypothetical protein